jgi:hypothetical protein
LMAGRLLGRPCSCDGHSRRHKGRRNDKFEYPEHVNHRPFNLADSFRRALAAAFRALLLSTADHGPAPPPRFLLKADVANLSLSPKRDHRIIENRVAVPQADLNRAVWQ